MLNKQKVFQQLQEAMPQFFLHTIHEKEIARTIWERLVKDENLLESVISCQSEWILPTWSGRVDEVFPVQQHLAHYSCFSVDGSQIYPDKHQGSSCYLLNIGTVELTYMPGPSKAQFDSIPSIHMQELDEQGEATPDIVNCKRSELEFKVGFEIMSKVADDEQPTLPKVFLCDGSLIFWHLESKDEKLKNRFLKSYIELLDKYYHSKLPILGYISLPKGKDITNLLRLVIEKNLLPEVLSPGATINTLVDADIISLFLPPWHRTQLFASHAPITNTYPTHLKPHFLYLNVVDEIVRIEMPAWIAHDGSLLETLLAIVVDQCKKGGGYPVALAEAHEQAVVKGVDREFFYQLLHKVMLDNKQTASMSQKLMKKRLVGI